MDLVFIVLTPAAPDEGGLAVDEQMLTDILWVNSRPSDQVEHVRVKQCPPFEVYIAAFFLLPDRDREPAHTCVSLCRDAIDASRALRGWTAAIADLDSAARL